MKKYSQSEISIGLPLSILIFIGFSIATYYFLSHNIEEKQANQRFAFIWFSVMMAIMGLSGILRFTAIKIPPLNKLSALLWSFAIVMFGSAFVLVGIFERNSISGGIPLMPNTINQWIGSTLFIVAGLVVILLSPKLYRYKRDNG